MVWTDMKVLLNISNLAPSSKILGYLSYRGNKLIHTAVKCLFKELSGQIMYYSDIIFFFMVYLRARSHHVSQTIRISQHIEYECANDYCSLSVFRLSNSFVSFKVLETQALTCTGYAGAHRCTRYQN